MHLRTQPYLALKIIFSIQVMEFLMITFIYLGLQHGL